jgi:hypothetical protein
MSRDSCQCREACEKSRITHGEDWFQENED